MDIPFSAQQASAAAEHVNSVTGPTVWLIFILAAAGILKMIMIGWGDRIQEKGQKLLTISAGGMVAIAVVIGLGGMFYSDKEVKAWIKVRQTVVDPILVDVLKRDSCNPAKNRFCAVVFDEDGREIVVNWHDKRVNAMKTYGDFQFTTYTSLRPVARPLGDRWAPRPEQLAAK